MAKIYLHPGREKSLRRKHPWIFSRGIERVDGKPEAGDVVDVYAADGNWLAKGAWSPESQIRVRIWSFDQKQTIDEAFFKAKFERALAVREDTIARGALTGFRLVAGETDGLPGITIDKYDNVLVCQLLSYGADVSRPLIVAALKELFPGHCIVERSDVEVRKKEGLPLVSRPLAGQYPKDNITIKENGFTILVDPMKGHKTGFYLDQRDSRAALEKYVSGKSVLNCFCYTGTFSLYALRGGATDVTNVDVSTLALETAKRNVELNELDVDKVTFEQQDVFQLLRDYKKQGKKFDVIVMDPPKFAESKSQITQAARGYKDINRIAMQLLNPGGYLLTFSCSGLMDNDLFQKVVADAALDANKDCYFVERLGQAQDHPVSGPYPEGFYLKGLVCKVF